MWETMFSWFILGSFMWWIISGGSLILFFWAIDGENFTWVTVNVVLYAVFLAFLGKVDYLGWVKDHPIYMLTGVIAYIPIGIVWSITKWKRWMKVRSRMKPE